MGAIFTTFDLSDKRDTTWLWSRCSILQWPKLCSDFYNGYTFSEKITKAISVVTVFLCHTLVFEAPVSRLDLTIWNGYRVLLVAITLWPKGFASSACTESWWCVRLNHWHCVTGTQVNYHDMTTETFLHQYSQWTPSSAPMQNRYGVSLMSLNSDLGPPIVTVLSRLCYNEHLRIHLCLIFVWSGSYVKFFEDVCFIIFLFLVRGFEAYLVPEYRQGNDWVVNTLDIAVDCRNSCETLGSIVYYWNLTRGNSLIIVIYPAVCAYLFMSPPYKKKPFIKSLTHAKIVFFIKRNYPEKQRT